MSSLIRLLQKSLGASSLALALVSVQPSISSGKNETATFAGGCFWGVESVFRHLNGVKSAVSGFAVPATDAAPWGPASRLATYAEAVRVEYDPSKITYRQLLDVFFRVAHDPTQVDRQGPDVGPEYRSIVFANDEAQATVIKGVIDSLRSSGTYHRPIVTEILLLKKFNEAEEAHQNYVAKNPHSNYVLSFDAPKLQQLQKDYASLYRN
ncbi:MAG: peptide-methionine (S)-S-oxide reductase MsrA [Gemmatimonadota bacterium]